MSHLRLYNKANRTSISNKNIFFLQYSDGDIKRCETMIPRTISEIKTNFNGIFFVKNLVEAIKMRHIKIPDGMRLYKIISNDIEVYPNINFWNDIAINPTIIFTQCDD